MQREIENSLNQIRIVRNILEGSIRKNHNKDPRVVIRPVHIDRAGLHYWNPDDESRDLALPNQIGTYFGLHFTANGGEVGEKVRLKFERLVGSSNRALRKINSSFELQYKNSSEGCELYFLVKDIYRMEDNITVLKYLVDCGNRFSQILSKPKMAWKLPKISFGQSLRDLADSFLSVCVPHRDSNGARCTIHDEVGNSKSLRIPIDSVNSIPEIGQIEDVVDNLKMQIGEYLKPEEDFQVSLGGNGKGGVYLQVQFLSEPGTSLMRIIEFKVNDLISKMDEVPRS